MFTSGRWEGLFEVLGYLLIRANNAYKLVSLELLDLHLGAACRVEVEVY